MTRILQTLRTAEDGQAVVELALILPVLLLVLFGIVDFGKALNNWNDETHVANLTARYAAVGNLPTSGSCAGKKTFDEFAKCEAEHDGVSGVTTCVYIPTAEVGQPVEVKVSSSYNWIPWFRLINTKTLVRITQSQLSGTATMRLEQVPPESLKYQSTPCP